MKRSVVALAIVLLVVVYVLAFQCAGNRESRFVVYGSMRCGFTVKMLDHLKTVGAAVRFVDVNTSTGNAEFKRVTKGQNIRGVPYTIDNETKKGIRGFQEIIL